VSWRDKLSLYLVTDRALCLGRSLTEVVEASLAGGARCVQLREKEASTREFIELGRALRPLCDLHQALLIINDRADVALACQADGLHVGQSDIAIADARALLGSEAILGLSVESIEQALSPEAAAADYLGVSPIFATPTKTDAAEPWGLAGLRQLKERLAAEPQFAAKPLVAIGGLNASNASEVIAAGADSLAVVSALCSSQQPSEAARRLLAQISAARASAPRHSA